MTDLTTLHGVGATIAEQLRESGYETVDDVLEADVDDLTEVKMIGPATAKAILTDGDEGSSRGRDAKLDDVLDEILDLAELPMSDRGVIRLSPICWSTHRNWKNERPEYVDAWEHHRGKAERKLAEEVARNDPRFLLERAFDYVKTEKREIDQTTDGEHTIRIKREVVNTEDDE